MVVAPTPLTSRSSFDSLPLEILIHISLYLDRPTALSFARVARRLTPLTDRAIWERLDLHLPIHYGTLPLILPHCDNIEDVEDWKVDQAHAAEELHSAKIQTKVSAITRQGSEPRWKLVRRIKMVQRSAAVWGMVQILTSASAYVEVLEIEAPADHPYEEYLRPDGVSYKALDDMLSSQLDLSFPSLTHLRLGPSAVMYPSTVHMLCSKAPNLVSLEVDMSQKFDPELLDDEALPHLHPLPLLKHLKRISFICDDWEYEPGDDSRDGEAILTHIISRAPHLQQLVMTPATEDDVPIRRLFDEAGRLAELSAMYLGMYMGEFRVSYQPLTGFDHLEDLVLPFGRSLDLLDHLPCLPMKSLFLVGLDLPRDPQVLKEQAQTHLRYPPHPSFIPTLSPCFAADIRKAHRLESIYLVPLDIGNHDIDVFGRLQMVKQSGEGLIARITSLRHGDQELLHVLTHFRQRHVNDVSRQTVVENRDFHLASWIPYKASNGDDRLQIFIAIAEPEWQEYIEFDGRSVPVDVLERMRAVEGISGEPEARGVEVGDKAWAVLTGWMGMEGK